jgi:predicted MFS family arabinose efflux permease
MSSSLAGPHERGRVVGSVMSGLLIGILLARTVSGLVAAAAGWRAVFAAAAVAMLVLAGALRRALPEVPPAEVLPYRRLMASIVRLVVEQPVLRQRMALGALAFGCFSVLWTSLAFLLSGQGGGRYHYGNAAIGLFGLAGVAGAAIAPVSGRLSDSGRGRQAAGGSLVVLLGSWGLLALGRGSVLALVAGIIALDLGVQGLHIANQSAIYGLVPEARSRLTTAYMVAYFLGGTLLSAVTSALYAGGGWTGVCILGAATAGLGLVVWLLTDPNRRAARAVGPTRRRRHPGSE